MVLRHCAPLPLQVQRLILSQLSRKLNTDVSASRITPHGLTGITFHDLVVGRDTRLPGGAFLRARQVIVHYAGREMLRGKISPRAGIRAIVICSPIINVRRKADGRWNFEQMIPKPGKPRRRVFAGKVLLTRGRIIYHDAKLKDRDGRSFAVDLRDVYLAVKFNGEHPIIFTSSVRDAARHFGRVVSQGRITPDGGYVETHHHLDYADAAYFFRFIRQHRGFSVETGDVSGDVSVVYARSEERDRTLSCYGDILLQNGAFRHRGLPDGFHALQGQVSFCNERIYLNKFTGQFGKGQFETTGMVTGFTSPVFTLSVAVKGLDVRRWIDHAPLPEGWSVDALAPVSGTFQVAGSLEAVTVSGEALVSSLTIHKDDVGRFHIASAVLSGGVENALNPVFNGTIDIPNMQWSGAPPRGVPVSLEEIDDVRIELEGFPAHPQIAIRFEAARGSAADVPFAGLRVEAQYHDRIIEVMRAHAKLEDGTVETRGRVNVAAKEPTFAFAGKIENIPGSIAERFLARSDISFDGHISGPFQLEGTVAAVFIQARLQTPSFTMLPRAKEPPTTWRESSLKDVIAEVETNIQRAGNKWDGQALVDVKSPAGTMTLSEGQVRTLSYRNLTSQLWVNDQTLRLGMTRADLLGGEWRLSGDLCLADRTFSGHLAGVDLDLRQVGEARLPKVISGRAAISGSLSGNLASPNFKGACKVVNATVDRLAIDYAEGKIDFEPHRLEVSEIIAYQLGGRYTGHISISDMDLAEGHGQISGDLQMEAASIASLLSQFASEPQIIGVADGRLHISGTVAAPRVNGRFTAAHGEAYGIPVESASVKMVYEDRCWQLFDIQGKTEGGLVSGEGWIEQNGRLHFTFNGKDLPALYAIRPLGMELPFGGNVSMAGKIEGSTASPQVSCRIETSMLTLAGEKVGELRGGVDFAGNVISLRDVQLTGGMGEFHARGDVPLGSESEGLAARLEIEHARLEPLLVLLQNAPLDEQFEGKQRAFVQKLRKICTNIPQPLGGEMNATVQAQGRTSDPQLVIQTELVDATLRQEPLPHTTVSMLWKEGNLTVTNFRARQADAEMVMRPGVVLDREKMLAMDFDIYNVDLGLFKPWFEEKVDIGGIAKQVAVQASGPADRPHVTLSADIDQFRLGSVTFDRVSALPVTISEQGINVEEGDLRLLKGRHQLQLWGHLPLDWQSASVPRNKPIEVHLQSKGGDLGVVSQFTDAVKEAAGKFDLMVAVGGSLAEPRFAGGLRINDGSLAIRGVNERIENVDTNISFAEDGTKLVLHKLSGSLGSGVFEAEGSIDLDPQRIADPTTYMYNVTLSSRDISFDLKPSMEGLFSVDTNILLHTDSDGSERITVRQFDVKSSTGGRVFVASGETPDKSMILLAKNWVDQKAWSDSTMHLPIKVEGLMLRVPKVFRGRVDANLALVNSSGANKQVAPFTLTGEATVSNATLMSLPESRIRQKKGVLWGNPGLDVRYHLGEKVDVETRLLRARNITGEGRVTQTPANLHLSGVFAAQRGMIRFPSTDARLLFGRVEVATRPDDETGEPIYTLNVNASAEAKVSKYQMRIAMNGPLTVGRPSADLKIQVQTTPPIIGEHEALQALLGLSPAESGTATEADMAQRAYSVLAGLFQQHPVFTELERGIANVLGIDTFTVDYEFGEALNVSVGEEIYKGAVLSYRRTVSGARLGYEYRLDYRLGNRTIIAFEADDRGLKEYKIERAINF